MQEAETASARVRRASCLTICAAFAFTTAIGCRYTPVQIATPAPPAAAIAAVHDAKRVFVLNGGEEDLFQGTYPYDQQTCYNEFYTALAQTGAFQLVQDPADANLTLTIEGVVPYEYVIDQHRLAADTRGTIYYPAKIIITLFPRGAKEPVYSTSAVPTAAKTDPAKRLAIAETVAGFANQLQAMTGTAAPPVSAANLLQATGPVPRKVLTGKRIFVMDDPNREQGFMSGADWLQFFLNDLKASNRYTIAESPHDADLVLQLSFNLGLRVRVFDGTTMNQLWTVDDPKRSYPGTGQKLKGNEAAGTAAAFLALTSTSSS